MSAVIGESTGFETCPNSSLNPAKVPLAMRVEHAVLFLIGVCARGTLQ